MYTCCFQFYFLLHFIYPCIVDTYCSLTAYISFYTLYIGGQSVDNSEYLAMDIDGMAVYASLGTYLSL